ncbi:MAG: transcription factor TFIIIC [Pyrodictiaceae archaeon]
MFASSRTNDLEERAIKIIKERGDEGIYQYELWKLLGLDSREGSRLALKLLRKGLITRKPVIHNGRKTYKLYIAKPVTRKVDLEISIGEFRDIPCFSCKYMDKCHRGGFYDPVTCPWLRGWIEERVREAKKPG